MSVPARTIGQKALTEEVEPVELAVLVGEELEGAVGELAVDGPDVPEEGERGRRRNRGSHRARVVSEVALECSRVSQLAASSSGRRKQE